MEEHDRVLAWICVVPIKIEELQRDVGQHNMAKESIPVLAFPLTNAGGEKMRIKITPMEDNKGFGLGIMAFINATRAGGTLRPTSTSYWKATRELAAIGLWPNKSQLNNVKSKIGRYTGGLETYASGNKKKKSWYKVEEVTVAVRTGGFNDHE